MLQELALGLGQAYLQKSMVEAAIAEYRQARELSAGATEILSELGHAYAVAGRRDEAQEVLSELQSLCEQRHVSPYGIAIVHLGMSEIDQALMWIERAVASRSHFMPLVGVDPKMDGLRADPRFEELLRKIGLPSTTKV